MAASLNKIKMAGAYEDDEVRVWHWNLERALKRREREEVRWRENENFDDLVHYETEDDVEQELSDRIKINKTGSWVNAKLASICFKNPGFVVRPVQQSGYQAIPIPTVDPMTGQQSVMQVPRYRVVENLMNFVAGQPNFGLADTGRRLVKAGLLSYGVVKVGYCNDHKDNPMPKDVSQEVPVGPDGKPDFSGVETDPRTGLPIKDKDGNWIPKGLRPTREYWFVDHVPAWNMVIDPDGGNDFYKHDWVAEEIVRPLDEVKKDRLLKNTRDLSANAMLMEDPTREDEPGPGLDVETHYDEAISERTKMVRLFEIYDFKTNRLLVVADGYGKFLRNDPIPGGIYHDPYVFFRPYEKSWRRGTFYPRPPATDVVAINKEINADRTLLLRAERWDAVQRYLRYKNAGGAVSDTELEKFLGPDPVVVIDVDGDNTSLPLRLLEKQSVSGSLFQYAELRSRDFDEAGGQGGESRGMATAKTATQADIMASGGTARDDYMRNQLAGAFRHIGKKLLDSLQKNMTLPMAVAIEGQDGQLFIGNVNPADIFGDYDVSVDVTEMMPRNSNIERQQFIDFLQVWVQQPALTADPVMAESVLDMWQFRNQALRDAFVRISQQLLMPPPPPGNTPQPNTPGDFATMAAQQGGRRG